MREREVPTRKKFNENKRDGSPFVSRKGRNKALSISIPWWETSICR